MKLYEVYTEILNEVGEGTSKPFPYSYQPDPSPQYLSDGMLIEPTYVIKAEAKGESFNVNLFLTITTKDDGGGEIDASFLTDTGGFTEVVNDRVYLFRLMATITLILKKESEKYKIRTLTFEPAKDGEEGNLETRRSKLYMAFVKKAFPNAQVEDYADQIVINF